MMIIQMGLTYTPKIIASNGMQSQPILFEIDLSDTEWTNAHALFARIQGQTDAVNQLEELIVEYTESGLRNELLSIPWYRTYLNHSRQFVFSGLLAIAIVLRFTIMPKRKRKGLSE